jgi:hypothetical protein
MVSPVAEIWDKVLANLSRRIFPSVSIKAFPISQGFEIYQPDREQYLLFLKQFSFPGFSDLRLNYSYYFLTESTASVHE